MDMDSTPPPPSSRSHHKSASRLSNLRHHTLQTLSLEIVPSSSPKVSTPSPASTVSPKPPYTLPIKDLILLSPSPVRKSKVRPPGDAADEPAIEASGVRKRCKTRNSVNPSPRSGRRPSRRKLEQESRDEKDFVAAGGEVVVKPRKKRHNERSRTGRSISNPPPPPVPSPSMCFC